MAVVITTSAVASITIDDQMDHFFSQENTERLKEQFQLTLNTYLSTIPTCTTTTTSTTKDIQMDSTNTEAPPNQIRTFYYKKVPVIYAMACDYHCVYNDNPQHDKRFELIPDLELYLEVGDIVYINSQHIDITENFICGETQKSNPFICLNRVFCHKSNFGKPPYYVLHIQPTQHLVTLQNNLSVIDFNKHALKVLSGTFQDRNVQQLHNAMGLNIAHDSFSLVHLNYLAMGNMLGCTSYSKRELWFSYFKQISITLIDQLSGIENLFKSVYTFLIEYTSRKVGFQRSCLSAIEGACQTLQSELLGVNRFLYFRKKTILYLTSRITDHDCDKAASSGRGIHTVDKLMLPVVSKENMDLYIKYYSMDINSVNSNDVILDDDTLLPKEFVETADLTQTAMNVVLLVYFTYVMLYVHNSSIFTCDVCSVDNIKLIQKILTSSKMLPVNVSANSLVNDLVTRVFKGEYVKRASRLHSYYNPHNNSPILSTSILLTPDSQSNCYYASDRPSVESMHMDFYKTILNKVT
jgi:hypothetical protein